MGWTTSNDLILRFRAARPRSDAARYKAEILDEYQRLDKAGKGALLRREAWTPR